MATQPRHSTGTLFRADNGDLYLIYDEDLATHKVPADHAVLANQLIAGTSLPAGYSVSMPTVQAMRHVEAPAKFFQCGPDD